MDPDKKKIRLSDIPRKEVFKTPEGYFDGLQDRINQRITAKPRGKVVELKNNTRWIAGLAAAATLALLVVFGPRMFSDGEQGTKAEQLIAAISSEDCLAYLNSIEIGMDEIVGDPSGIELSDDFEDALPATPEVDDESIDLLYEKYGVTEDEKMQTL